jgi:hypothetical protein
VQLGALDIKAGTYAAKFSFKCHTCGICLSAQLEISIFTRTAGPHPVCQLMGTDGCHPVIQQSAHETHHSPPSGASITNMWICTFTPTYASLTWCLFTHTNDFSFTYWMMKQCLNMPHPRCSLFKEWTSIKNTMLCQNWYSELSKQCCLQLNLHVRNWVMFQRYPLSSHSICSSETLQNFKQTAWPLISGYGIIYFPLSKLYISHFSVYLRL